MSAYLKFLTTCLLFVIVLFPLLPNDASAQATSSQVKVIGDEEVVFDWTTDRCEDQDIPDLPVRAFRDGNGDVQLISTHFVNRRSVGADLDSVTRDCNVIMQSNANPDPALYSDKEWIASTYTEDGQTIYAVLHNEYQGHTHAGQCPSGEYFNCWYNALTMAVSRDGGATYERLGDPPDHLAATLPYPYEAEAGPYGMFEPSNMLEGPDGYIYMFTRVDDYKSDEQWVCLLRTDDLENPSTWRAWDGAGFNLNVANPHTTENPRQQLCAPVARQQIGTSLNASITFNSHLQRYVLVGLSADQIDGREVWGVYYSFSTDLIHWSHRQLLMEAELPWTYQPGDENPLLYPALLDPESPSRNFSTTDQDAYLYFTRFNYANNQMTLDRDLMRVPVYFFRSNLEAENPESVLNVSLSVDPETGVASGRLTTVTGEPVSDAVINFTAHPVEDSGYNYTLEGTVPQQATRAVVGYRINTECDCSGSANLTLYGVQYVEGDNATNLIPDADFSQGQANWNSNGTAELVASDREPGMMWQVDNDATQSVALTSSIFPVEAGTSYTLTFESSVYPSTEDSGYFAIMFLDDNGEITRERIDLTPNIVDIGSSTVDSEGFFELSGVTDVDMPYLLTAIPEPESFYLPARASVIVQKG